jgi:hypothetical protein
MVKRVVILAFASIAFGAAIGYFFGYDQGYDQAEVKGISSFVECKEAGYPIQESYPERCVTPDGSSFENPEQSVTTEEPPVSAPGETVFCTMDARLCPDGSYVGRVGPDCQFETCPGE